MMMARRRTKGFKLGRKVTLVCKWVTRFNKKSCKYEKLNGVSTTMQRSKTITKLCKWGNKLKHGLFNSGSTQRYNRLGQSSVMGTKVCVPKGHLAVHVGEREGAMSRVVVPVMFLNHPLFGKLLREAEDVYGYNYSGQIMIPCPISEFESVKANIAATSTKCRLTISTSVPCIKCFRCGDIN